jgi:uncharacterized repeat protein (TIGR01451 family)
VLAARTFFMLGEIFRQQSRTPEAIAAYRESAAAIDNDPRLNTDVALRLAELLTGQDDVCGAAAEYQQAVDNTTCTADRDDYAIEARDFQIQCKAQSEGETIQSSKMVASSTGTAAVPCPACDPDSDTEPALSASKSSTTDGALVAGVGVITYTLWVTNAGGEPAYQVVVTDDLDSQVLPVTNTVSVPVANPFVWKIGSLGPGETVSVTLVVAISPTAQGDAIYNRFEGTFDRGVFTSNTVRDPIAGAGLEGIHPPTADDATTFYSDITATVISAPVLSPTAEVTGAEVLPVEGILTEGMLAPAGPHASITVPGSVR